MLKFLFLQKQFIGHGQGHKLKNYRTTGKVFP